MNIGSVQGTILHLGLTPSLHFVYSLIIVVTITCIIGQLWSVWEFKHRRFR